MKEEVFEQRGSDILDEIFKKDNTDIEPVFSSIPNSCIELKDIMYTMDEVETAAVEARKEGYMKCYNDFKASFDSLGYNMLAGMVFDKIKQILREDGKAT